MTDPNGIQALPRQTDIFVGIDGTGPGDKSLYDAEFASSDPKFTVSFVRQLYKLWGQSASTAKNARWYEGPDWKDLGIRDEADTAQKAADFIVQTFRAMTWQIDRVIKKAVLPSAAELRSGGGYRLSSLTDYTSACLNDTPSPGDLALLATAKMPRIFLAGWSRGGAGVIRLANLLRHQSIEVDCLMLYDAVRMSSTRNVEDIPDNVRYCYHAKRDPATNSRPTWGNCGNKAANPGKTVYPPPKYFFCTHAGMGGLPWVVDNAQLNKITGTNTPLAGSSLPGSTVQRIIDNTNVLLLPGAAIGAIGATDMLARGPADASHRYIVETPSEWPTPTNVTVEQDVEGSRKVGLWMGSMFDRVLGQDPPPYVTVRLPRPGSFK